MGKESLIQLEVYSYLLFYGRPALPGRPFLPHTLKAGEPARGKAGKPARLMAGKP